MAKKAASTYTSLANHFLVALPRLEDPNFSKAVVYAVMSIMKKAPWD